MSGGSEPPFYAPALSEAEIADLDRASHVEGLDQEVAQPQQRKALTDHRDDFRLLKSGMRLLVQALLAQHRLSPAQPENLSEVGAALLRELGEALRIAPDVDDIDETQPGGNADD